MFTGAFERREHGRQFVAQGLPAVMALAFFSGAKSRLPRFLRMVEHVLNGIGQDSGFFRRALNKTGVFFFSPVNDARRIFIFRASFVLSFLFAPWYLINNCSSSVRGIFEATRYMVSVPGWSSSSSQSREVVMAPVVVLSVILEAE